MNYMKKVAEIIGVEIGEKFDIYVGTRKLRDEHFKISEEYGLMVCELGVVDAECLRSVLIGELWIKKISDNGKSEKEVFSDAIKINGSDAQIDVAIEEMAELIQAIVKFRRYGKSENAIEYLDGVIEEKEDVKIMMDQLDLIYGDSGEMRDWKVKRLLRRLEVQSE